jgi:L-iditol 2-dehydrogenase
VDRARVEPGDTAVVIGLGSIGCLFTQLLKRAGAVVLGVDPVAERAALARTHGADVAGEAATVAPAVRELSERRGADLVMITAGGSDVLAWAAAAVRDGGGIHYFAGGSGDALPLPLATLYHRELTVTSTYSSSPATLARAFWLLAAGKVEADGLITHRVPLERLAEGVELMRRRQALKVYVTP